MTKESKILEAILKELNQAEEKHPDWPEDLLHKIAVLNEESGEATRAALQYVYEGGKIKELKIELTQTAAMCIRILKNLDKTVQTRKKNSILYGIGFVNLKKIQKELGEEYFESMFNLIHQKNMLKKHLVLNNSLKKIKKAVKQIKPI